MSRDVNKKNTKFKDLEGFFRIYSNGVKVAEFKDNLVKSKKELDKFLKEKIGINGSNDNL